MCDIKTSDFVKTHTGYIKVKNIKKTSEKSNMYDLLNVEDSQFLTNDIVSHNSTTLATYALWYALFNDDKFIGIVSNKFESAKDILSRIKKMYEVLPTWLKPGSMEYNKNSVEFENGTKIQISATSASSFRR